MQRALQQFSCTRYYARAFIALAVVAMLLAPGAAGAQGTGVSGTVTDTTGGVLPGVTVEVRDATGGVQTAFTDGSQPQRRPVIRGQRHDQHRRRRRVAERAVPTRGW